MKKLLYPAIFVKRLYLKKKIYYENLILDNLSELLLNEPIIKAEEFLGCFLVDSKSDLFRRLVRQKNYEPILVELTLKYLDKNRDAIDVGANVGFYTNLFAKSLNNRKVLAIEPTENSLKRLFRNIEINKIEEKVIVFKGAVLDYIGRGEIKTLNGKEEYSTIGAWQHPAIQNKSFISSEIKVSTVDSLVNSYNLEPGFMKIDVEGMEHLVLKGSENTLKIWRPVILLELSDPLLRNNGSSSKEVIDFLKSFNYKIIDAETPEINPLYKNFTNILCVPE